MTAAIARALLTWPGQHGWKLSDFYSDAAIRELAEHVGELLGRG